MAASGHPRAPSYARHTALGYEAPARPPLTRQQTDALHFRLRRLLGYPADHDGPHPADDTLQDAAVCLVRYWAWGHLNPAQDSFEALLYVAAKVVRDLRNDSCRRKRRRKESGAAVPDVAAPAELCPVEWAESEAAARVMEDGIRSLRGPKGAAARMKWLDGMTQTQIAGVMHVSQGQVCKLLTRARRWIRE